MFHYIPLLGHVIAFKDYQPYVGIADSPWVGLDNFQVIFSGDPAFLNALTNTLVISLLQLVFVFPLPIAVALLLNSLVSERFKRLVQSVLYLPHFMSWVIVVAIFQHMLGNAGLLNSFLQQHDLRQLQPHRQPRDVQGADRRPGDLEGHRLGHDPLPRRDLPDRPGAVRGGRGGRCLPAAPAVARHAARHPLRHHPAARSCGWATSLNVGFEQIILQQQAVGPDASEVLDTYVFNNAVGAGDWGASAAAGLVKGIIGVVLVLAANKVAHLFGERGVYQK